MSKNLLGNLYRKQKIKMVRSDENVKYFLFSYYVTTPFIVGV